MIYPEFLKEHDIIGVTAPSDGITYEEAIYESLKDLNIPIIINTDIGHVSPRMTIINGAIAIITSSNGKGKVKFELK